MCRREAPQDWVADPSGRRPPAPGWEAPLNPGLRRKSPVLAALLSGMPGLGQIYVGYYQKGFSHALVVAVLIALLSSGVFREIEPLLGFFMAFFWMYNVIDASRMASLYNEVMSGMGPEDLRQKFVIAGRNGSILGGLVLTVFGFLFLLNRIAGLPLDWLKDWWPAVPLAFGVYLLYKGIQDRRERPVL